MAVNAPYADRAIQSILDTFAAEARPGNIDTPLFAAAARCYEFVNAGHADRAYVESRLIDIATQAGHALSDTHSTLRSAHRQTQGKQATIPAPTAPAPDRGPADLTAYAAAHGVDRDVFARAGWDDAHLYEYRYTARDGSDALGLSIDEPLPYVRIRRALRITTDGGPRYRLIDDAKPKPKYWQPSGTHTDARKVWYRLSEALALAAVAGHLVLCNGEASAVVAQHYGVSALCEAGGGEKATPDHLVAVLRGVWTGRVIIALDGDGRGRAAALKKRDQYAAAGYDVRAIDLGDGLDLADFCRIHTAHAPARLIECPDLTAPAAPNVATPAPAPGQIATSAWQMRRLEQLGFTFRLNLCGQVPEVNGAPIDDRMAATIRTAWRDAGGKVSGLEDTYLSQATPYHPVRDVLDALPAWDGVCRIAQLAACMHGLNPAVTYQDGQQVPLPSVYLHRWMIGVVAKVYEHGQNGMLVLAGPQGTGKSFFARWCCLPALQDRYFLESPIDPHDKDTFVRLASYFLWEVGELDATTRRADVAALKDVISLKVVTVRRSYARYDMRVPSMASFIGTVNTPDFLVDETGNRRFYVIDVQHLDRGYAAIDRDQLWAEALHRYRAGEAWALLPEEEEAQSGQNRRYMADGPMGDYLRRYLFVTGDPDHLMTSADVIDLLREKQIPIGSNDRAVAMDISRAMAAMGVKKIRNATGRYYSGVMAKR